MADKQAKSDEQMNRVIRLLAGREVEMEGDEEQAGRQYEFAPEMRTDADVTAWIRRKAGRA